MKSLRVALTRPTSLYKGGNGEEFGPLCLFNIQKKGTGKNPIPLLQRTVKIDIFVFGAEGAAAYKTGPVCSMPASCAGAIFNSGRSFR